MAKQDGRIGLAGRVRPHELRDLLQFAADARHPLVLIHVHSEPLGSGHLRHEEKIGHCQAVAHAEPAAVLAQLLLDRAEALVQVELQPLGALLLAELRSQPPLHGSVLVGLDAAVDDLGQLPRSHPPDRVPGQETRAVDSCLVQVLDYRQL